MLFPWLKNRIEKRTRSNINNENLIQELKIEGITENNILFAIRNIADNNNNYLLNSF